MKLLLTTVFCCCLIPLLGCTPSPETDVSDEETMEAEVVEAELWEDARVRFQALPDAAPDPENSVTAAKVELGKKLLLTRVQLATSS